MAKKPMGKISMIDFAYVRLLFLVATLLSSCAWFSGKTHSNHRTSGSPEESTSPIIPSSGNAEAGTKPDSPSVPHSPVPVDPQQNEGPLLFNDQSDPYLIKGVHHIFNATKTEQGYTGVPYADVVQNKTGHVIIMIPWDIWESQVETPNLTVAEEARCSSGRISYRDQACYYVEPHVDAAIKNYATAQTSNAPIQVTLIIARVPAWARKSGCTNGSPAPGPQFCALDSQYLARFGLFASFIAERYKNEVSTYVIGNEVNAFVWYNTVSKNLDVRTQSYADYFSAAYRAIKSVNTSARLLIPLTHAFSPTHYAADGDESPVASFLPNLASKLGTDIEWSVAFHPYPHDITRPDMRVEALDEGVVTHANIGVLESFLLKNFPSQKRSHEIFMTESGFARENDRTRQAKFLCDAYRAAVGTPHVMRYFYYSFEDNPGDLSFGLVTLAAIGQPLIYHPAWNIYARSNQWETGDADCGFESVGLDRYYTELKRGYANGRGHWLTSRVLPEGFTLEARWLIERRPRYETRPIYECARARNSRFDQGFAYPSTNLNCENSADTNMGLLGYIPTAASDARMVKLVRCKSPTGAPDDYVVLANAGCAAIGFTGDLELGYAWTSDNSAPSPAAQTPFTMHGFQKFYALNDSSTFCRVMSDKLWNDLSHGRDIANYNRWPSRRYVGACAE